MSEQYLDFDKIINEVKEFCKDHSVTLGYRDFNKEVYIESKEKLLEQLLNILYLHKKDKWMEDFLEGLYNEEKMIEVPEESLSDYFLLGIFFEGLIKVALLKEDFDFFFQNLENLKSYENAKNRLVKVLQKRDDLNEKMVNRINHVLTYMQVQRNNFLHFPMRSMVHECGIPPEILSTILKMNELYNFNFSEDLLKKIRNRRNEYWKYPAGNGFEPVGWEVEDE